MLLSEILLQLQKELASVGDVEVAVEKESYGMLVRDGDIKVRSEIKQDGSGYVVVIQ